MSPANAEEAAALSGDSALADLERSAAATMTAAEDLLRTSLERTDTLLRQLLDAADAPPPPPEMPAGGGTLHDLVAHTELLMARNAAFLAEANRRHPIPHGAV